MIKTRIHRLLGNQFKKPAGILGKVMSKLMLIGNGTIYDNIISDLDIKQNERIFEIGYGHGLGIRKISTRHECFISGIDYSKLMFSEALQRNREFIEEKKVDLILGDFLEFESRSKQYDKIFCVHVIYFWTYLQTAFKKVKELLTNGGVFCIYMANEDFVKKMKFANTELFNKYKIDQVISELRKVGFKKITYTTDKKGYYIKCQ